METDSKRYAGSNKHTTQSEQTVKCVYTVMNRQTRAAADGYEQADRRVEGGWRTDTNLRWR